MLKQPEMPLSTPMKRRYLGPCALIFTAAHTGDWRSVHPSVDESLCIRCGTCQRRCPVDCIMINKDGDNLVRFDWRYCKGCGICAMECPVKCISLIDERTDK